MGMKIGTAKKIRRVAPIALAAGAVGLGMLIGSGCKSPVEIEPIDEIPQCPVRNISPTSGNAPHSVNVQYSCTDDNGMKEYTLTKGNEVIYRGKNSIDTVLTFPEAGNYDVKAGGTDTGGHTVSYGPVGIQVTNLPQLTQSFSQSVSVPSDSLKVDYKVTAMENLDSAKVRVQRDEALVDSMMIRKSQVPFTKTYDVPGIYKFISDIPGLKPDTTTGAVKDYIPVVNLSNIPADSVSMNEGDSVSIDLESRIKNSDPNPGDNPVIIDDAMPADGKVKADRNGYDLKFSSVGDSTGTYRVDIVLKNSRGKPSTATMSQGQIYDLPRIRGTSRNSETDIGTQSTLIAYEKIGPGPNDTLRLQTSTSDDSLRNVTDLNGNFDIKIKKRSADLEKIILMGRLGVPGNYQGWARVIEIPSKDTSGVLITPVPYGDYASVPEKFKQFMEELVNNPPRARFDFNGEYIPGFQGLQGIEILSENPFGAQYGTFTTEQQNNIKDKILDPNDINGIIGSYMINPDKILIGNRGNFTLDSLNKKVIPNQGWIIVSPRLDMVENGLTERCRSGVSLSSCGTIYLKPGVGAGTISHEFGHLLIGPGHPLTLLGQTVMSSSTVLSITGPADKKAGKIIYQPIFMTLLPDQVFPSLDLLNKILREDFK